MPLPSGVRPCGVKFAKENGFFQIAYMPHPDSRIPVGFIFTNLDLMNDLSRQMLNFEQKCGKSTVVQLV
jgi:hypothetical protein